MYQSPQLQRFGTFREMTQQGGKTEQGFDTTPGWTGGLDCGPGTCRS